MEAVSFTIRRPSPSSRQPSSGAESDPFRVPTLPDRFTRNESPLRPARLAFSNSDDEREEHDTEDEIVVAFDKLGAQRLKPTAPSGPLVIPPLKDRDWKDARKRRAVPTYVPEGAKVARGADGSQGGLGTRDVINSGPEVSGLVTTKKRKLDIDDNLEQPTAEQETVPKKEETEDELALKALLDPSTTEDGSVVKIGVIPMAAPDEFTRPLDETDAFRQDVLTRPDECSLEDYQRVPVSQFGAALLRGMGWKEGTAASKTRSGPVKPWTPEPRPALLGIGAKEREAPDDGSKKKGRPDKQYLPLLKKELSSSSNATPSPKNRSPRSRSPSRKDYTPSRDGSRSRHTDKDRDRDSYRESSRESRRYRDEPPRDEPRRTERERHRERR